MIDITMVGIDHNKASIDERELFSFTSLQTEIQLKQWKKDYGINACLLLSTCNRTELWLSGKSSKENMLKLLCSAKELNFAKYEKLFDYRVGSDALMHLLRMTCGLQSMIRGEDQILSQVKEALDLSRKANTSDTLIEKLFQTSLSAGKKVKTNIKIDYTNPSLAEKCSLLIQEKYGKIEKIRCLIIGNGLMAQLTAKILKKKNADVSMTLRRQFHGKTEESSAKISGCKMIEYDDRLKEIEKYKVVISVTRSPHFTIRENDLTEKTFKDTLWIDMAVPRDIEPQIGEISGIQLFDMDEIGSSSVNDDQKANDDDAEEILSEYAKEFEQWYEFRRYVDLIKSISTLVKDDIAIRTTKSSPYIYDTESIQKDILNSSQKSIEKLLFGLKETLPNEQWQDFLVALEFAAKKDTIKT